MNAPDGNLLHLKIIYHGSISKLDIRLCDERDYYYPGTLRIAGLIQTLCRF